LADKEKGEVGPDAPARGSNVGSRGGQPAEMGDLLMTREFRERNLSTPHSGSGHPSASSGFVVGTEAKARVPLFATDSDGAATRDPFAEGLPRTAEAGETLERQFLLADSRTWLRPDRLVRLLCIALLITSITALTAGSLLLYRDHEADWQAKLQGVQAQVVDARNENSALSNQVEQAEQRLAEKSAEHAELSKVTQKTVVELQTSLAEARALRTKVADIEETKRQLEAQRLADLGNLVPPFVRAAWRRMSHLRS